jgi:Spy/CpxP family protein refolding chaperone
MNMKRPAISRRGVLAAAIVAACCVPHGSLRAQRVTGVISDQRVDTAGMVARMAAALREHVPASVVLRHRNELRLTRAQVKSLEALVPAETEAGTARLHGTVTRMQAARADRSNVTTRAMQSWSGAIDEAGIRAEACRLSAMQAESLIEVARERRTVGALLTPAQRAALEQLQAGGQLR